MSNRATLKTAIHEATATMEEALFLQDRVKEIMNSGECEVSKMDIIAIELINNLSRNNLMFYESLLEDIDDTLFEGEDDQCL